MRALFVTKHLRVGGAQRLWAILVPGLRERGIDARVLTLEDEGEFYDELDRRGVPVACARMRGRLDLRALGTLRAGRPDVVVTHDERSHFLGALLRVPQVLCDYGSPGFPWKPHRALVLRLVGPRVAAAVTVSATRNPDLAARGVPAERIRVIPNGVDGSAFRPARTRAEVRAELGLEEDAFVALLPVVLRPEKHAPRFVRAVARAATLDRSVRGLVAGYGPEEAEVRALAEQLGGAVSVLGHRDDMPDLVEAVDAVCLTSDLEAVPYALLEAMALARPVVAMRAGALAELVEDGVTGRLVPAADIDAFAAALTELARDPVHARALGAAGQARQREGFDAAGMCDAYADLLRALAARSSTAARAGAATPTE